MSEWQNIDSAPKHGKPIKLKVGAFEFLAYWSNEFLDSNNEPCGGWVAEFEEQAPPSWTDGCCWEVNADEGKSDQPTHWQPMATLSAQQQKAGGE